jgi:hypothetical protein
MLLKEQPGANRDRLTGAPIIHRWDHRLSVHGAAGSFYRCIGRVARIGLFVSCRFPIGDGKHNLNQLRIAGSINFAIEMFWQQQHPIRMGVKLFDFASHGFGCKRVLKSGVISQLHLVRTIRSKTVRRITKRSLGGVGYIWKIPFGVLSPRLAYASTFGGETFRAIQTQSSGSRLRCRSLA